MADDPVPDPGEVAEVGGGGDDEDGEGGDDQDGDQGHASTSTVIFAADPPNELPVQ